MRALRFAAVALAAAAAGWLTVGIGMANLRRNAAPEQALAYWPLDARAKANLADRKFRSTNGDSGELAEISRLARASLMRDPTMVKSWRVLGTSAGLQGDADRARNLVRFAERVSRRDLQTQLWLVSESGRIGSLEDMLRHADAGLRSSPSSWAQLAPVLIASSIDPRFAAGLARLLQTNPPWERDFSYRLSQSLLTGPSVPLLVGALADGPTERELMYPIAQRLATARDFNNAWRVYRLLKPGVEAAPASVRGGTFDETPIMAPFDWVIVAEGSTTAERRNRSEGDNIGLFLRAEAGASGDAASQMLLLPPGRHALTFAAGTVPDVNAAALEWRIFCAVQPTLILGQGRMQPAQPTGTRLTSRFAVPANCPAQVVAFAVRSNDQFAASESWIDDVVVARQ